jgi:protein-serine/threonine kinase
VSLFLYHEAIIDSINKRKQTSLLLSCIGGFEEILQQLITAGADINAVDIELNSGLHLAVINCNII